MHAATSPADRLLNLATRARWRDWLAHVADTPRRDSWPHTWLGVGRGVVGALIISCAFVRPDPVAAQVLWRGLNLGATPKTVSRAFPDAKRPPLTVTLADGETDDLVTNAFFVDDRFMEVRFFFREGGLTAVMLSPASIDVAHPAHNLQAATTMAGRLTSQYGPPFDCGDKSYAQVALYECKWLAKPIVIRLWYLDVLGEAPSLRVVFRKADDAAYDF
jgi:hypothetical protein